MALEPERCEPALTPVLDGYLASDSGLAPRIGLVADFDGDGQLDVALADGHAEVAVLRGNGDGSLAAPVTYPTNLTYAWGTNDSVPNYFLARDVNGDGRLDLVTANKHSEALAILFGEEAGLFSPGTTCPAGGVPQGLAAADFDGDMIDDLAFSYRTGGASGIKIVRGDGSCTSIWESSEWTNTAALGAGDFNGDGWSDLLITRSGWHVLLGAGPGVFVGGDHYDEGLGALAFAVEDLDGDGASDVAVSNVCSPWTRASTRVFLGTGDGSFAFSATYEPGSCRAPLVVSDVTGDGVLDLVPRETLPGLGDGTFGAPVGPNAGLGMLAGAGDFDGDGVKDLVAFDSRSVAVRKGNGDGTFGSALHFQGDAFALSLVLTDLDGDGELDVVTGNGDPSDLSSGSVSVWPGTGDGAFANGSSFPLWRYPSRLTSGDLDGDGRPDLLVWSPGSTLLSVLVQEEGGGFAPEEQFALAHDAETLAVGDVNGDARLDVVVAGMSPPSLSVLLGTGDGRFGATIISELGDYPAALTLLDADADGRLDLALGFGADTVRLSLGRGDGTFMPHWETAFDNPIMELAAGDLNRDGAADLVVGGLWSSRVLLGEGEGRFTGVTSYPFGGTYAKITDLDGDAFEDLLTGSGSVSVLKGTGDGRLGCFQTYWLGGSAQGVATGDVNGDGREDVVALLEGGVNVYLNAP